MNTTFKCWLIANFEIVFLILMGIAAAIFLFIFADFSKVDALSEALSEEERKWIFLGPFFLIALNSPTKSGGFQFGKYFVLLGAAIVITLITKQSELAADYENLKPLVRWFWIVFPFATVISIWLASFTRANISEVLSRRMLYRNSNVSLFEYTWKYVLDRFCNISFAIISCTIGFVVMIKVF